MTKNTLGNFGEVARLVTTEPVDWETLFHEEVKKRRSLEGQVSNLNSKVSQLASDHMSDATAIERIRIFQGRVNDIRRGIAQRLFAALIARDGIPQGDELEDAADRAVDAADALLDSLVASKR